MVFFFPSAVQNQHFMDRYWGFGKHCPSVPLWRTCSSPSPAFFFHPPPAGLWCSFTATCTPSLIPPVRGLLSIIRADNVWPAAECCNGLNIPPWCLCYRKPCSSCVTDVRLSSRAAVYFICSSITPFLALILSSPLDWLTMYNLLCT